MENGYKKTRECKDYIEWTCIQCGHVVRTAHVIMHMQEKHRKYFLLSHCDCGKEANKQYLGEAWFNLMPKEERQRIAANETSNMRPEDYINLIPKEQRLAFLFNEIKKLVEDNGQSPH
jgi:hypothetical protein